MDGEKLGQVWEFFYPCNIVNEDGRNKWETQ